MLVSFGFEFRFEISFGVFVSLIRFINDFKTPQKPQIASLKNGISGEKTENQDFLAIIFSKIKGFPFCVTISNFDFGIELRVLANIGVRTSNQSEYIPI